MFLLLCRGELCLHLLIDEFACGLFFLPGGFVARLTGGFALLHPFCLFGRHGGKLCLPLLRQALRLFGRLLFDGALFFRLLFLLAAEGLRMLCQLRLVV